MDILEIAEENFLITIGIVLGIGVLQGSILGRGIRRRFPKLKTHARIASLILLVFFSINAISNTLKFAIPEKLSLSEVVIPVNPEEGLSLLITILGLNTGFGTVIAMFVSISIVLFLRFAEIPRIAQYFIFILSVMMLIVAILSRFTDYIPNFFQILIYASYQFGITLGIFLITRRKQNDSLPEIS